MPPEIPLFVGCLILSAFFSGSETALMAASRINLRRLADEGDTPAKRALDLIQDPRRLLAGILVGNNIFNVLAASAATTYAVDYLALGPGAGMAVASAVSVVLLVLFSEFLPKTLAALEPIAFARRVSGPIRVALNLLAPAVIPLEAISRPLGAIVRRSREGFGLAELRVAVSEGVRTGVVDKTMARVLRGGLAMEWKTVGDALIPRVDISAVDAKATYEECLDLFRQKKYSRLLVHEGSPDEDLGYLAAKDLSLLRDDERAGWTAREGIREALRVPAALPLPELLARMRSSGVHFAVVKDEYGGTEGIVTLEDLLEELVGEIRDEHDEAELPPLVEVRPGIWMVRGDLSVKDLSDRLRVDLASEEARTVGGLIAEELGRVPRQGDAMETRQLRIVVTRADGKRVRQVRLERRKPEED
jgi:CBS domain containing-hemolysin-like protein